MSRKDELLFVDKASMIGKTKEKAWKVIIADDEEEVHAVTRMVLDGFSFEGRRLELLGTYSGSETKAMLQEHSDTAVLLLDVVMEEETTGFEVVRYIREELKNKFVRIIMRTGQPGQAPERRVTMEYDINDYKEKTELTAQKLFTTIIALLRAYRDLRIIETHRKGLEHIVTASAGLFELRSLTQFISEALVQLTSLLNFQAQHTGPASGLAVRRQGEKYRPVAGIGKFSDHANQDVKDIITPRISELLIHAEEKKESLFSQNAYVGYFPIRNGSKYLLYIQGEEALTEIEQGLIKFFATNIAVGFDNFSLNQEIEETQKEVIFTLGEVVETRSHEAGYHVKRVGEYCYLLAIKYGLGEETAELLRVASPMHDVGKIGIPDAILNKPGKLSKEEFDVITTHTTIGYDILKGSHQKILTTAAIIALQHHERWDGLGYPQGLAGEQVNIFARITKIADVFDALRCKRVYKESWSTERILEVFRRDTGTHFDSVLVDLFMENLDEFLKIGEMFPDGI